MEGIKSERIKMLKKQAAEHLDKMWTADENGEHELAQWHWDQFVRAMNGARELKRQERK